MNRFLLAMLAALALASCDFAFLTSTNTNNNGSGGINAPTPTPSPSPTPACSGRPCVTSADCCLVPAGSPEQCVVGVCL